MKDPKQLYVCLFNVELGLLPEPGVPAGHVDSRSPCHQALRRLVTCSYKRTLETKQYNYSLFIYNSSYEEIPCVSDVQF
jgi:hypothetical protein